MAEKALKPSRAKRVLEEEGKKIMRSEKKLEQQSVVKFANVLCAYDCAFVAYQWLAKR